MAFGPAYFTDRMRDPMAARDSTLFSHLGYAAPWSFCDYHHAGKRGVLAFWDDGTGAPGPDAYGPARACADGLVYLAPLKLPTQEQLAKANGIPGMDYATSKGVTLTIPFASCSAREISFAANAFGDASDEFARSAAVVWNELQSITISDPRLIRMVMLAIAQNYRVTPELLDDLRWVTSRDIEPIFQCVQGLDPKANADAETTSPSSASASSKIPA